jgi:hypothetical protein
MVRFGVGMLHTRPLPRLAFQFVVKLTVEVAPLLAVGALFPFPILAGPIARLAMASTF